MPKMRQKLILHFSNSVSKLHHFILSKNTFFLIIHLKLSQSTKKNILKVIVKPKLH